MDKKSDYQKQYYIKNKVEIRIKRKLKRLEDGPKISTEEQKRKYSEYHKQYYELNKENINERRRLKYQKKEKKEKKEKKGNIYSEFTEEQKQKAREYQKSYTRKNKERVKKVRAEYYRKNSVELCKKNRETRIANGWVPKNNRSKSNSKTLEAQAEKSIIENAPKFREYIRQILKEQENEKINKSTINSSKRLSS
jgi:hypothetical protein